MRALILTITDHNFGNRLQNLALQEYLRERGFSEVKTLSSLKFSFRESQLPSLLSYLSHPIDTMRKISAHMKRSDSATDAEAFMNFDRSIDFFHYDYDAHSDLSYLNDRFDVFITGSDQVFNPDYFTDDPSNLMLGFARADRAKIAFAPSIAIEGVSDEYKKNLKRYLSDFDGLSCREIEGAKLISEQTERDCEIIPDPTLLFDSSFYSRYEKEVKLPTEPYLLLYSLGERDERELKKIHDYAERENLIVIEPQRYGPGEFLYAISHASQVITNSFHGCVFSLLYHKPLFIYERRTAHERSMFSRISSLFTLLGLDHHDFLFDERNTLHDSEAFFSSVDQKMNEERERTDSYLDGALRHFEERDKVSGPIISSVDHVGSSYASRCMGCYSCYSSCPQRAIEMVYHEDGFLYPEVDEKVCVRCGLCLERCPLHSPDEYESQKQEGYLMYSRSEEVLRNSSSGGVFYELAEEVMREGGFVAGCVFDEARLVAEHQVSDDIEVIKRMCGSKYIESEIGDCHIEIKGLLDEGRVVLFTGTPCQCEGLLRFLGKRYDDLLLVDIFCHGVASREEILRLKKRGVTDIRFRHKEEGWHEVDSLMIDGKIKKNADFLTLYHSDKIIRDSCRVCNFKGRRRKSDITIGDFWGIDEVIGEGYDLGKSLVIINSSKGREILRRCESSLYRRALSEEELDEALSHNPSYDRATSGMNIYDYGESFARTYHRRFILREKIRRLFRGTI